MEKISQAEDEILAKTAAIFSNKATVGVGPQFARISFFQQHSPDMPVFVGSFIMALQDAQALAEVIQATIAQASTAPKGGQLQ